MGKLEDKSSKNTKRKPKRDIGKIVLQVVAAAGVLGVSLVAPNVIGAMGKIGILPNPRDREIVNSSAERMRKKGLFEVKGGKYMLTPKGRAVLMKWTLADYILEKPKEWDGKWRIVIFDIPEKFKKTRERMRLYLSSAGFLRLQNSVWVFPYDCEDIIALLKTDYGVGKYVLYLIVDQLENDETLKAKFGLPA